jgi:hypothetical protein
MYLENLSHRPSWLGGVAAAKPQTGWWFNHRIDTHLEPRVPALLGSSFGASPGRSAAQLLDSLLDGQIMNFD